jgi:hypothetical protein
MCISVPQTHQKIYNCIIIENKESTKNFTELPTFNNVAKKSSKRRRNTKCKLERELKISLSRKKSTN